jgi:RNA polymerase sigma-70 factor (ECF subfamily)
MLNLINQAKSGSQIAFYQIWNHYHKSVYYFILNKTHNENLSSEITNTTFMKAFLNIKQYNPEYEFSTWLFTIARNALYGSNKSKGFLFVNISEIEIMVDFDANEFNELEQEKENILLRSINELNDKYKKVITLRLKNYKHNQIAQKTGLSEANVRVIINRAKNQLTNKVNSLSKICAA